MRYITTEANANYEVPLEVRQGIETLIDRCRRPVDRGGLGIRTDAPTGETVVKDSHVAAWLLARALALPPGRRDQFLREGREILDEHPAQDEPYPIAPDKPCDAPPSGPGDGQGPVAKRPVGSHRLPAPGKRDGIARPDKPGGNRRKAAVD